MSKEKSNQEQDISQSDIPAADGMESLKADAFIRDADINSTIVVFGSARTKNAEQMKSHLAEIEEALKRNPSDDNALKY